jgi:hypothetical protein
MTTDKLKRLTKRELEMSFSRLIMGSVFRVLAITGYLLMIVFYTVNFFSGADNIPSVIVSLAMLCCLLVRVYGNSKFQVGLAMMTFCYLSIVPTFIPILPKIYPYELYLVFPGRDWRVLLSPAKLIPWLFDMLVPSILCAISWSAIPCAVASTIISYKNTPSNKHDRFAFVVVAFMASLLLLNIPLISLQYNPNLYKSGVTFNQPQLLQLIVGEPLDLYYPVGVKTVAVTAINTLFRPYMHRIRFNGPSWRGIDSAESVSGRDLYLSHCPEILEQKYNVVEHNGFAEIEIHERYKATSHELSYSFVLPDYAVPTSISVGENSKEYEYTISPKMAARQMYEEQIVSPKNFIALVEKTGPNTYKIRVFRRMNFSMWFKFKTLPRQAQDGNWEWPMPKLLSAYAYKPGAESWLPESLPAQITTFKGLSSTVRTGNSACKVQVKSAPVASARQNILVLISPDRSVQTKYRKTVRELVHLLSQKHDVTVRVHGGETYPAVQFLKWYSEEKTMTNEDFDYYRYVVPEIYLSEMLCNVWFDYDRIIPVLAWTDSFSDISKVEIDHCSLNHVTAPLSILMPTIPTSLQQSMQTQRIVQKTSVLTNSVVELIDHIERDNKAAVMVQGNYAVDVDCETIEQSAENDPFAPLAANLLVNYALKENNVKIQQAFEMNHANDPNILSRVHSIAKQYGIVTYYSSMIAMVNDQHKLQSKEWRAQYNDKFYIKDQ